MNSLSELSTDERIARLRLSRSHMVGPITFHELLAYFGSATLALEAIPELARRGGRSGRIRIASKSDAVKEMEGLEKLGGRMIFWGEAEYPTPLETIDSAPPVLSVIGHPHILEKSCVAIVGTRRASASGLAMAEKMAREIAFGDCVIVSGLALGIDGAAHRAAIQRGTAAVIAGGVDVPYPPEHRQLYQQIAEQGCLLSEMPFGVPPKMEHFPRRNRIISGLSLATVIVEAPLRSGAMITARMAAEQGRIVCVVPSSPIDPRAEGGLALLRDNATLVRNGDDVLEEIARMREEPLREPVIPAAPSTPPMPEAPQTDNLSDNVRDKIVSLLGPTPTTTDELIRLSGEDAHHVSVVLMELACAGRLRREPGQKVALLPQTQLNQNQNSDAHHHE